MKKILLFIVLLFWAHMGFSQTTPMGAKNNTLEALGGLKADSAFCLPLVPLTKMFTKGMGTTGQMFAATTDSLPRYMKAAVVAKILSSFDSNKADGYLTPHYIDSLIQTITGGSVTLPQLDDSMQVVRDSLEDHWAAIMLRLTGISVGNLSPLFTASATSSVTPAITFTLTPAAGYTILGNNTASPAAPAYFAPSLIAGLFQNQGTATTVLHGNVAGNLSFSAISMTTDIAGTLPVANGGTGVDTWTNHAIPIGNITSAITFLSPSSSGKIVFSNGIDFVMSTPTFPNSSATAGKLIKSDGTNWIATTVTFSDAPSTAGKIMVSDGTNWATSTPTFPNASATSGKVIKSDGTNWVASTETFASPGTSGNVATSDGTNWTSAAPVVTASNTITFTNKRFTARVLTTTNFTTSVTIDADSYDMVAITAQAGALLLNAPSGTPTQGQILLVRIKDDGTSRALTYNSIFRAGTSVTPPTATTISKVLYLEYIYNTVTPTWDLIGYADGF